jgi:hypothetical protein
VGTSGTTGGELGVGDNDVSGVQVALLDVRRTSGDTVTVKWQYRNTNSDKANVREIYSNYAATDAYVLDPVNKKKYMVLRDATNEPIAEKHDSSELAPGQRITSWAKFPAPPPDVTKVTVAIPHVAPFEDVTIR